MKMSILEMPPLDLEHGCATSSVYRVEGEGESVCFSDVDERLSCYSQFYSTADGYEDYCGSECGIAEERVEARSLSAMVEIDNVVHEVKVHVEGVERDCRICHLALDSSSGESGVAIELGCSCKNDLAAGNKTCEICNSIARNVVVRSEADEMRAISSNSYRGPVILSSETRSCFNDFEGFGLHAYTECQSVAHIYKRVTSGVRPKAMEKVKDPEVKAFIEKCLGQRRCRPSASQLLEDPFFYGLEDEEPSAGVRII